MTKIVLVCNAGMSTSILANRMKELGNGEYDVNAYGEQEYLEHALDADVILVGPQVRYLIAQIKEDTNNRIPVESIEPRTFGTANAKKVFDQVNKILKKG